MNIELKNVKIAASLSEETLAFTANLYVDGFHAYAVSNHGQGGCNFYHAVGKDVPSIQSIEAAIVAAGNAKADDFEILDCYLSDLLDKVERERRLDRMLKSKIVVIGKHNGGEALFTYPAKYKPTPQNIALALAATAKKGETLLNNRPDLREKALALV